MITPIVSLHSHLNFPRSNPKSKTRLVPAITLYTKPNCPLCDKALEQIELARREIPFDFVEINILSDLEIYQRYKHDIPVIQLNGIEVFRYRLTCADLLQKLVEAKHP